jgi:hypothetical protein
MHAVSVAAGSLVLSPDLDRSFNIFTFLLHEALFSAGLDAILL